MYDGGRGDAARRLRVRNRTKLKITAVTVVIRLWGFQFHYLYKQCFMLASCNLVQLFIKTFHVPNLLKASVVDCYRF